MGRKSNDELRSFYIFDSESNKTVCKICNKNYSGNHFTNLKRHFIQSHKQLYDELCNTKETEVSSKKNKITYEIDKDKFVESIIEILTDDGRPLAILDSSGFKYIVDPIFEALKMDPITSHNAKDIINEKAENLKREIKKLVKNKIISLKVDVATRLNRSILGINMQIVHFVNGKINIVIKNLAMISCDERITGEFVKDNIMKTLDSFEININQLYR